MKLKPENCHLDTIVNLKVKNKSKQNMSCNISTVFQNHYHVNNNLCQFYRFSKLAKISFPTFIANSLATSIIFSSPVLF